MIGPDCIFRYSWDTRTYVGYALPLLGLAIYGLLYLKHKWLGDDSVFTHVHSWRRKAKEDKRKLQRSITRRRASNEYENSLVHASLNWLDINYVPVMIKVFYAFQVGSSSDTCRVCWLVSIHLGAGNDVGAFRMRQMPRSRGARTGWSELAPHCGYASHAYSVHFFRFPAPPRDPSPACFSPKQSI